MRDPTRFATAPATIARTRFMWPEAARRPAVGMITSLGNGKPQLSPTMRTNTARRP